MTVKYSSMSNEEIVEFIADVCVQQFDADFRDQIAKYNRLFAQMMAAEKELKSRGIDAQRTLTVLLAHPNVQVRLQVAIEVFDIVPERAEAVLRAISRQGTLPQAADATLALHRFTGQSISQIQQAR